MFLVFTFIDFIYNILTDLYAQVIPCQHHAAKFLMRHKTAFKLVLDENRVLLAVMESSRESAIHTTCRTEDMSTYKKDTSR